MTGFFCYVMTRMDVSDSESAQVVHRTFTANLNRHDSDARAGTQMPGQSDSETRPQFQVQVSLSHGVLSAQLESHWHN